MQNIQTASVRAPGFLGLNLQDSVANLDAGFALEANNCIVDQKGRIGSRRGWKAITTSIGSYPIGSLGEFIDYTDSSVIFACANNKIYRVDSNTLTEIVYGGNTSVSITNITKATQAVVTAPNHKFIEGERIKITGVVGMTEVNTKEFTVTEVTETTFKLKGTDSNGYTTYTSGGTAAASGEPPIIIGDNWKQVSLNGSHYFFQEGHAPLVYDPDISLTTYRKISDLQSYEAFSDTLGVAPEASTAIVAYGRIWAAGMANDKDLLCFSSLLDGKTWNTGTAGTLDVMSVWADGSDAIQALAAFNNYLFIFGKRQILIYRGAEDPSTMYLEDIVKGIGCVSRDSIAYTGSDVIFLSEVGVMSLLRTIQEKSAPLRDLSMNVRDDLVTNMNSENKANIKASYYARDAFYIIHLPVTGKTYCFDTRRPLENGGLRVTTWEGIDPVCMVAISDNRLLFGKIGVIGLYSGYTDNGASYTFKYKSTHFDFDKPTNLKILKKIGAVFIGGNNQTITAKWAYDYEEIMDTATSTLKSEKVANYNIDEYGIGEYSDGTVLDDVYINTTGNGETVQIGFEAVINDIFVSMQRIDCYYKYGKTHF